MTDEEWGRFELLAHAAKGSRRKREANTRGVVHGVTHALSAGCRSRPAPKDLPPRSKLCSCSYVRACDGLLDSVRDALNVKCSERSEPRPHLLVDTKGLLTGVIVHCADIQDRNGGVPMRGSKLRSGEPSEVKPNARYQAALARIVWAPPRPLVRLLEDRFGLHLLIEGRKPHMVQKLKAWRR